MFITGSWLTVLICVGASAGLEFSGRRPGMIRIFDICGARRFTVRHRCDAGSHWRRLRLGNAQTFYSLHTAAYQTQRHSLKIL